MTPKRTYGSAAVLQCFAACLLCATGCGESARLAPVSGTVRINGKPLAKAGVTFTPVVGGRPAWATTDEQGRFTLTTFSANDGAFVGDHSVTVAEVESVAPVVPKNADPDFASLYAELPTRQAGKTAKPALDAKFASRSTSGLSFTVKANEENQAEFDLNN